MSKKHLTPIDMNSNKINNLLSGTSPSDAINLSQLTGAVGGTSGKLAKFTGANVVGDSIIAESGSVITISGSIVATTGTYSGVLQSTTFTSTVATGTPPLTVASTTKVINLNADLLDGFTSADFVTFGTTTTGYIPRFTSSGVLGNSSIYETGGSVGINSATLYGLLTIGGSTYINGSTNGSTTYLQFKNNATDFAFLGSDNAINAGSGTDLNMYVFGNNSLYLSTNGVKRVTINGAGAATFYSTVSINGATTINGASTGSDTYLQFKNNSSNIFYFGSDNAISAGSGLDFTAYVYGNNQFHIATNNAKRLSISGAGVATFSGVAIAADATAATHLLNRQSGDARYIQIGTSTFSSAVTAPNFISTIATGTAPLTVTSTTVVTNLNADLLDGQHGSYYQSATNINAGTLADARLSANVPLLNMANTFTAAQTSTSTISAADATAATHLVNRQTGDARYRLTTSNGISSSDTRNAAFDPSDWGLGLYSNLQSNTSDGLGGSGSFHGVLTFRPYGTSTDFTVTQVSQLAFGDGGTIYSRVSTAANAWGSWKTMLTQQNGDTRYATLAHNHAASEITSGTFADARLSANVALLNVANTFSATQTVPNGTTSGHAINLGQLQNAVSGTSTYLPKFMGVNTVRDSQILDNGTNVKIGTTSNIGLTAPTLQVGGVVNATGAFVRTSSSAGTISVKSAFQINDYTQTATLAISMPIGWTGQMLNIRISGYDYAYNTGAWSLMIGGFNFSGGYWNNPSATFNGNAPFSSVRLAYNATTSKCVLLLGTTATAWNYPKLSIDIDGFGSLDDLSGTWAYAFVTSEAAYSAITTITNVGQNIVGSLIASDVQSRNPAASTGYAKLTAGSTTSSGYIEFWRANNQRNCYIGYGGNTGSTAFVVENSSYFEFSGGRITNDTYIQAPYLILTVAVGTAPLTVTSTTVVTNLNADLLDGQHGSYYQSATNINAGTLADARLSSNVPLKNASNTFSALQTFSSGINGTFSTSADLGNDYIVFEGTGIRREAKVVLSMVDITSASSSITLSEAYNTTYFKSGSPAPSQQALTVYVPASPKPDQTLRLYVRASCLSLSFDGNGRSILGRNSFTDSTNYHTQGALYILQYFSTENIWLITRSLN